MKRFVASMILIFVFVSNIAFSESLNSIANAIYSTSGAPKSVYNNAYFWYLKEHCIMIQYNRLNQIEFIAFTRNDGDQITASEIFLFLKDKGAFELRESRLDGDEYRAQGLVAVYSRDDKILFIIDEKKYAKKQNQL